MDLVQQAFAKLWPEKQCNYSTQVKYSGKFSGYNANVKLYNNLLTVNLSKQWRQVSKEIKLGLIQELLVKILKQKTHTLEMDLYNNFLKNVHIAVPKTKTHPILQESFTRINEKYFYGLIENPNLVVGSSLRKLGTYEYGTDTLTITKALLQHPHLLDYVMYHELLHKKHKFQSKHGRHRHHTHEFRKAEKAFPNSEQLEKELQKVVRKQSIKKLFGWF